MRSTSSFDFTFELMNNNGKELVHVLQQLEKRLEKVQQRPPKSTKHAMQPAMEKLIAKELLSHPDTEVNISVACCISEAFRIMVHETPYNDEKMKEFFELVVITFEKLSATSGGCYDKMTKVPRTLGSGKFSVMMCDLQLDGLLVRLFKQFLSVADSNSAAVVIKMKQIMAMIIEKTELLNHKLVDHLVNSVREDNKVIIMFASTIPTLITSYTKVFFLFWTSSPVCWQLGREVLMKCDAQLKPHLPKKVAEEFYSPLMETIPSTTGTSKLRKDATRKRKLECLDGSRNMVQAVRRCGDVKKHKKKTLSTDDPPMPTNIETEAQSVEHGENLVGRRIKVWWSRDKVYYQGVVKSFDCRNKRHKVLYDDGEEEILDLKQERWKLVKMASKLSAFDVELMNAGKGLLVLPSSTAEFLNVLEQMKKLLHRVELHKGKRNQKLSESMKYAMHPIIEALVAKKLLRHLDMDVNISVACCICDVLRIMKGNAAYTNEQMKDFFELAVTTFEKLSSATGGCYTKVFKVLKILSGLSFSVLESDLRLNGLIVRLFKQFLTVADSNSAAVVIKMKQIMAMIVEKTELVNHKLVDLLVNSVREDNKTSSPVCWQLGRDVLMKCAAQLKPHLPKKVAEEFYSPLMETIPSTTGTSKLRKDATRKRKLECLDGSRNVVQPLRRCRDVTKRKKKSLSTDDPPMPTNIVTEAQSVEQGENLVGRRIKVWWSRDKVYYQGVVKSFDCRNKRHKVLYDDGEEEILDLKQGRWKLVKMASKLSTFDVKLMNAGKGLLVLPTSITELLNVLEEMEKLLHRVQLHKGKRNQKLSESMKYAMHPIIEALVAKKLLRHLDMDVNISVACCICDVLRIMEGNAAYTNEQMKDFFELAVTTFEKLSSATGGCYTKVFKVLKTLNGLSFSVLESDLRLNGLIIRLFKQFLTVADSNSDDVVLEMKKILTIIIEESEPLNLKLVDPLVTSVRKENQITSPVCWKLGNEVLEKYAAQLKPHIQDKVAKEEWDSLRDSILSTTDTRKLTKNAIRKMKLGCPDGGRNRVQPVRRSKDATMHTVLHDNRVERLLDIKREQTELVENVPLSDLVAQEQFAKAKQYFRI